MLFGTMGAAMQVHRSWQNHTSLVARAVERLASGCKLNRAVDDASGMMRAQKLRAQLSQLEEDQKSELDHLSGCEQADSMLGELQEMLDRMNELAVKAANGTLDDSGRYALNAEYQQLLDEAGRMGEQSLGSIPIYGQTKVGLNTKESVTLEVSSEGLHDFLGSLDGFLDQVSRAAREGDDQTLLSLGIDRKNGKTDEENLKSAVQALAGRNAARPGTKSAGEGTSYLVTVADGAVGVEMKAAGANWLGLADTNLLDAPGAHGAMEALTSALDRVSDRRSELGASMNRIERTLSRLSEMETNLADSYSRIADADIAREMMVYTKERAMEQVSSFLAAQLKQQMQKDLQALLIPFQP